MVTAAAPAITLTGLSFFTGAPDQEAIVQRAKLIIAEGRFLAKVNFLGPIPPHRPELGSCWLWTGFCGKRKNNVRYGIFWFEGRNVGAHRWSYEHFISPLPEGLEPDHLCRTPRCVNPLHIEAVTHAENMRRRFEAITHCPRGHEYTAANTRLNSRGPLRKPTRSCRRCHALLKQEKRRLRQEAA